MRAMGDPLSLSVGPEARELQGEVFVVVDGVGGGSAAGVGGDHFPGQRCVRVHDVFADDAAEAWEVHLVEEFERVVFAQGSRFTRLTRTR